MKELTISPVFLAALLLLIPFPEVSARSPLDLVGRRADRVEDQRFTKKIWESRQSNSLMERRFPLEQWNKHYSSLGSKRAPIPMVADQDRPIFQTRTLPRKTVERKTSRWSGQMADLQRQAQIETGDQATLVRDRDIHSRLVNNVVPFRDMGETLSLRDINRYQFRRNESDGPVPVRPAGGRQ